MSDKNITRRRFIKNLSATCACSGLYLNSLTATAAMGIKSQEAGPKRMPDMQYRTLGRTGLRVSALSFGVLRVWEPAVIFQALEMGVNFYDTCGTYKTANVERMLGSVLKEFGRKKAYVATKVYPMALNPPLPPEDRNGKAPLHVKINIPMMEKELNGALKRLQTDYVDVLYLHDIGDPDWELNEDMIAFLEKTRKAGKARFTGISFHVSGQRFVEVVDAALKTDYFDVFLAAFNFKSSSEHIEALKRAHEKNIGIVAMKTQAGGYRQGATDTLTPHQAALKWVLDCPFIDCAVPGMVVQEMLQENAGAVGKKVGWHDRKVLSNYYAAVKDRLCLRCSGCSGTCSAAVDIPAVHRMLMYWEGYQDFSMGRDAYRRLSANQSARTCVSCSAPTCRCVNGMNIPERMRLAHTAFA